MLRDELISELTQPDDKGYVHQWNAKADIDIFNKKERVFL